MDGSNESRFGSETFVMILLISLVTCSPFAFASTDVSTQEDSILSDGRIVGFLSDGVNNHSRSWEMIEGQWLSLTLDCQSCTAVIELDGTNYQTSKEHTLQAQTNGTVQMTITSTESEHVYYSLIEVIDENYPKIRPKITRKFARKFTRKFCRKQGGKK